jgi:hypothetical protein
MIPWGKKRSLGEECNLEVVRFVYSGVEFSKLNNKRELILTSMNLQAISIEISYIR